MWSCDSAALDFSSRLCHNVPRAAWVRQQLRIRSDYPVSMSLLRDGRHSRTCFSAGVYTHVWWSVWLSSSACGPSNVTFDVQLLGVSISASLLQHNLETRLNGLLPFNSSQRTLFYDIVPLVTDAPASMEGEVAAFDVSLAIVWHVMLGVAVVGLVSCALVQCSTRQVESDVVSRNESIRTSTN